MKSKGKFLQLFFESPFMSMIFRGVPEQYFLSIMDNPSVFRSASVAT